MKAKISKISKTSALYTTGHRFIVYNKNGSTVATTITLPEAKAILKIYSR